MKRLPLTEDWFHGAVSMERREEGLKPWRIPFRDYDLYPPEGIGGKAAISAGVRLRLRTDSSAVSVTFAPLDEAAVMDCLAGGERIGSIGLPAGAGEACFSGLPDGMKELEIWLPANAGITVAGIAIDAEAAAYPLPDTRPRWIAYGSSITQCVAASGPSRSWPAIAASACGYQLTSLGFSGNCHMEPMIGRLIRDLPADFISLCVGVNMYGAESVGPRIFRPLLIGLLETIRDRHRDIPLLVISPIYGTVREHEANALGFTLPLMREAIRETVGVLRKRGDRQLYYLNGLDWLGPEDEALLTDGLHPGAEGYEAMGRRFPGLMKGVFGHTERG